MTNKQKLNKAIVKLQALEQSINDIRNEVLTIVHQLPEDQVDDGAAVIRKLKYEKIDHNNPATWIHISTLPESVLTKWEQRLWLFNRNTYNWANRAYFEQALGEKGRKAIDTWFWSIPHFIKGSICDPLSIQSTFNGVTLSHSKGNVQSIAYLKQFFDMLEEEILAYESR